ncbi:aromatic amino acid lyase [Kribbella sp. CA-293567]|uniref:aromatic amino acid lyase n=1 Tax=Kribbella sp. CA-293567 TaxID=3002436 RepID=UPI0022DD8697|nr:aromatic amino acid lyase [Kribbella sp. CA-293567]WBQ04700.1 aromatic amino acid lyase [Kribbella sp. CA-293567]
MRIDSAADLDLSDSGPIELSAALIDRLRATRAAVLNALATGAPVYGVNTGMGALSKVRLTEAEQRIHQRNLLLARAAGGEPWLPPAEARAVLMGRLKTFLTGDSGVSPELCLQLVAFLNSGLSPAIPAGGAGSAGEIIPLAHAFGPLAGIGSLLVDGAVVPAAGKLPSFELGPKEGIALLAGIPGATGRAWLQVSVARRLTDTLSLTAAGGIAVIGASRDPYSPLCARGDELLAAELEVILRAAGPEAEPRSLQAPVSFRVAGQVISHLRRSVLRLEEAVERAFTGVTDSPAFLDGDFVGTAGFHGIDLAAHCDQLVAALAHAAEVSTARIHRLLDPGVTGLSAQLAVEPGPQAGLVTVHKRAVATSHYLRRLALPSAIGALETSAGQEDVQSFSWEAAGVLGEAVRLTREVAACELLAVHQAFALSRRPVPAGLRELFGAVADVVPPIVADRPFGVDLARLLDRLV